MRGSLVRLPVRPLSQSAALQRSRTWGVHYASGQAAVSDASDRSSIELEKVAGNDVKDIIPTYHGAKRETSHGPTSTAERKPVSKSEELQLASGSNYQEIVAFHVRRGNLPPVTVFPYQAADWLRLLQAQIRTRGRLNVLWVWACMRASDYELPTQGLEATKIWRILLDAPALRRRVFEHAYHSRKREGKIFEPLYALFMQAVIRDGTLGDMKAWHSRFANDYVVPSSPLPILAQAAVASPDGLAFLRSIRSSLYNRSTPLYDQIIPTLLSARAHDAALDWHQYLMRRNDCPSREVSQLDGVRSLQILAQSEKVEFFESAKPAQSHHATSLETGPDVTFTKGQASSPQERRKKPARRGLLLSFFKEIKHAREEGFSDDFCARLYATTSLDPSWTTSVLHAFSVSKLGPLALRELALRSSEPAALRDRLAELRAHRIVIERSNYSRAIQHFAELDDKTLLQGLLDSDSHPDNFESEELQQKLLQQALRLGDVQASHLLATLLSMFKSRPEEEYYNVLMRGRIFTSQIPELLSLVESARMRGVKISGQTVLFAKKRLLPYRNKGQYPTTRRRSRHPDVGLRLVSSLAIRAMESGTQLPEDLWVEVFKRLGMSSFEQLERFCHATVAVNTVQNRGMEELHLNSAKVGQRLHSRSTSGQTSSSHSIMALIASQWQVPTQLLLNQQRLQTLIAWGFNEGFHNLVMVRDRYLKLPARSFDAPKRPSWRRWPAGCKPPIPHDTILRGLQLVQDLRDRGVPVEDGAINKAIKQRLLMLFGPGRSTRRRNVSLVALNPYSIREVLFAANQVWKGETELRSLQPIVIAMESQPQLRPSLDVATASVQASSSASAEANASLQLVDALVKLFPKRLMSKLVKDDGIHNSLSTRNWSRKVDPQELLEAWAQRVVRDGMAKEAIRRHAYGHQVPDSSPVRSQAQNVQIPSVRQVKLRKQKRTKGWKGAAK